MGRDRPTIDRYPAAPVVNITQPEAHPGPPAAFDRALTIGGRSETDWQVRAGVHDADLTGLCGLRWGVACGCCRSPVHEPPCRCSCDTDRPLIPTQTEETHP